MKIILTTLFLSVLSFHSRADCPLNTPYEVNGTCTTCPSGTILNPYLSPPTCVSGCPTNTPATDDDTGWCSPCPDDKPFASTSTSGVTTCQACGSGESYDRYSATCVTVCPSGSYSDGSSCQNWGGPPRCYSSSEPYMYGTSCYASCPPLTQADSGNTCYPCSGDTLNWNDTNPDPKVQCVTNCPANKPNNLTNPHICTACDSTTRYWNHYTGECVSECAVPYVVTTDYLWCETCIGATGNQYFWDPVNETCVDICPDQLPTFDENYTCVACNGTTLFFLIDNRSCVETCPSWSISWNQYNICQPCPIEQPLWIQANQTCNACPPETPYWSNQTQACVATCYGSTPNTPDYNETTSWCQNCNNTDRYWNNTIHQCVSSCPDTAPYTNGSLWCLPCPDSTPVWIDYLIRCNETCPISMPDTNDIGWCVPCDVTTPFYNYTAEECQACPVSAPYYDSNTYSCVDPCPVPRPDNDTNNWCQACSSGYYWDNFTVPHLCNTTCPRAAPLKNTSTYWCDACSSPTLYYNKTGNTCISSCAPPLPLIGADNWCDPCPSATPYWDPMLSPAAGCAAHCSASVPFVDYRNVCVACSTPNPYWDPIARVCVPTCPIDAPFANSSNVCIACQGTKWNYLSSSCVNVCPVTIPYVNSSNWCSACSGGTHYNSDTTLCVSSCPHPKPFIDSNNWCQPCPNYNPYWDTTVNPGRCVPNCPVSMPNPGLDKWCEDCAPSHWNPITSSCTPTCNRPKPAVNTYNWCDFCPNPTPYWDVTACVPSCPHERPSANRDKECQSCPNDMPNWDSDASICVQTCPPRKPVVGTDNWCEPCPSATPYWYSGNGTCVSYCPPVAPSIDDNNWCQPCSGATLKWNPLSSTCVSKCPDSISFWNANAIPAACEVGPDIGDIVQYLDTAGMVSTITLAGLQLAWPGIPYVALTILLVNILKYIRYLDINYPPEAAKMFQNDHLNVPSLNFGPLFPENWKISTLGHPAPARFAQYDISGVFVANFWRGITTALILAFGVGVMKAFLAKKISNEKAVLAREKAKAFLIWNYIYSFFISNVGNIVLFIFIEYHSLYLYDVMGTISFILTIVFGQISLLVVITMIKSIKGVYKARKNGVKEQMKPELTGSFKVLLEKYKNDHLQQMLFIPIMCIRAAIAATLVAAPHAPVAQCSLLVVLNIISLAYHIKNRPHRELVDNVQLVAFETTLLVADLACLYLSTLPWDEQYKAVGAGRVIIACNIMIFILALLFILTRIIIAAIRLFKEKFIAKRAGKGVYVQTDVTGSEIDPSTVQLERMESSNKSRISKKDSISHKENRLLSMSFASSANLDVGTEEDQSPAMKNTRNLNSNNLGTFNVIRVPDDEREQMSNYFETQE